MTTNKDKIIAKMENISIAVLIFTLIGIIVSTIAMAVRGNNPVISFFMLAVLILIFGLTLAQLIAWPDNPDDEKTPPKEEEEETPKPATQS